MSEEKSAVYEDIGHRYLTLPPLYRLNILGTDAPGDHLSRHMRRPYVVGQRTCENLKENEAMFPAARQGDPITHDIQVPSGVIGPPLTGSCPMGPVLIEGLPAAHVNCTVVCSGATSLGPAHPPPPPGSPPPLIVTGAPNVFIHGMPAARWLMSGDQGACAVRLGDPKLIATRSVFIGNT
jgi:uncharacterized Zn-binding protein involved in type VI secretion